GFASGCATKRRLLSASKSVKRFCVWLRDQKKIADSQQKCETVLRLAARPKEDCCQPAKV
ncbi:MAG: hypothetical protein ABF335_07550, partial [Alphaproteobacteria bacterium]